MPPRKKKALAPMPEPGTIEFADWIQTHADTLITTLQEIIGKENWQKYMCAMFGTIINPIGTQNKMLRVRLNGSNNTMLETMAHLLTAMAAEVERQGFDKKEVALDKLVGQLLYFIDTSKPEFQVATE